MKSTGLREVFLLCVLMSVYYAVSHADSLLASSLDNSKSIVKGEIQWRPSNRSISLKNAGSKSIEDALADLANCGHLRQKPNIVIAKETEDELASFLSFVAVKSWTLESDSCNGIILTRYHILTSANCIRNNEQTVVTTVDTSSSAVSHYVERKCFHEGFNPDINMNNNLVILKLEEPLNLEVHANVCLPENKAEDQASVIVSYNENLRRVEVEKTKCISQNQHESNICYQSDESDYICQANMGSPIVAYNSNGATLMGIVSQHENNSCFIGQINTLVSANVHALRADILEMIKQCS